jgi:hypothetical protein
MQYSLIKKPRNEKEKANSDGLNTALGKTSGFLSFTMNPVKDLASKLIS